MLERSISLFGNAVTPFKRSVSSRTGVKVEQAKQELEHWKAIANVQAERKAEAKRQEAEKAKEEAKDKAEETIKEVGTEPKTEHEENATTNVSKKQEGTKENNSSDNTNAPKEQRRKQKANTKKASKETVSPSKKRFGDSVASDDAFAKVRKKLEERKNFYKKAPNRTRGFITNVSVDLGLTQHESSQYRTFTTKDGKTFTFRISNHNTDARTFDEHGKDEGISIVISSKKNKGIRGKDEAQAHVKEFFYPKKAIENDEGKPLASIIESIETMLETGEYVDNTGLARVDSTNVPIQTRRTCESVANALGMDVEWVDHLEANGELTTHDEKGNKLDRPVIRIAKDAENPLGVVFGHEGTHAVRLLSEESYQSLKDAVKGIIGEEEFANRLDEVKERYKDKNLSQDQLEEEVVCDVIGETLYNNNMLSDLAFRLDHKVLAKLKDVAQRMWEAIKQLFGKQTLSEQERKMVDYALTINAAFERAQNVKQEHELQTAEEVRKYTLRRKEEVDEKSRKYFESHGTNISEKIFDKAQSDMDYMAVLMYPYMDATARGNRILPEERYNDGNVRSTIFNNGSYGRTMENTLKCIRTLAYNQFVDAVKTKLGRPITQRESFLASQMVYDIATDPQCLYCYVSLDRKAYDEFLLGYINDRDGVLDKFRALSKKERNIGKAAPHTALSELYKDFLHGRKDTSNMQKRFDNWIRSEIDGSPMISAKDLATKDTRSAIISGLDKALAAQVKDAEKYAQSASWAKKDVDYISYTGELLGRRMSNRLLKTLLSEYGLRFYSFSEYTPAFILENMQMVRDAALRGLNGLAYTKVVEFAKIFAPTGMNINVSCYGRLDKDGNMVMDTLQGADWELVKELRDKYPNVGAVFVATSDKAVEWALNQDWIDVVIPFHIVRTGSDIADFYQWKNHSSQQSEHYIDKPSKTMYVSPVEHHNDKLVFLNVCEERGLTPRFTKWLDNKNYMKLVNETRRSIDETSPLRPIFDMEAAEDSWRRFVNMGGYYNNWWQVSPEEYNRCVQQVVDDIREGKEANQVDYGRQDLPADLDKLTAAARRQRQHGNTPLFDVFDPHGNALQQAEETDDGLMFRTSEELNAEYGDRWLTEQTNEDGRHTTQVKNTIYSYKKFGEWVKDDSKGRDVSVLDASSGLGLGTEWMRENGMDVDDVEPYPSENRTKPTFASYDDIDKKYDYIISNAVLNVIPSDWRANVLHNMADKLKDGGKMVINVRGAESIRKQGKEGETRITLDDPSEILVLRPNGSIKAYQKGFTKQELKEWCESELGNGYSVEVATNKNAGGSYDTAVVVTKNNESNTIGAASEVGHPRRGAQTMPKSNANLGNNSNIAKKLDRISESISKKGEMGAHEFLYNLSKAFGFNSESLEKSYYKDLGTNVGIRIADHYANASNFEERGENEENYGIVVKLSRNRFKDKESVNYLEYVYFPDKLSEERQLAITQGLKDFLETGDFSKLPDPDKVNSSGKFKEGVYRMRTTEDEKVTDDNHLRQMTNYAHDVAEALNVNGDVEVVTSEGLTGKKKQAKGWYDPKTGKITIVADNHTSMADMEQTMLHEAVAHKGLRALFGERFTTFLDNVFTNADADVRQGITDLMSKNNWDARKATEEYLASLAETTNFEEAKKNGVWEKIKDFFRERANNLNVII